MKKLILSAMWSKVLLLTLICVGFIQAKAASTDLGAIELDKVYDLPYSEIKGTFTPTKSGTLLQDGGSDINIYTDAAHSKAVDRIFKGYGGTYGPTYTYEVTAGTTYYLYAKYNLSSSRMMLSMGGTAALEVTKITPENGSVFSHDTNRQAIVTFSSAITAGSASVTAGSKTGKAYVSVQGMTMWIDLENTIRTWCNDGTLNAGDEFTVTVNDIKSELNGTLYNGDGKLTLTYKATGKSAKMLRASVPSTFKSYFAPTDPESIVTLTFDSDLDTQSGVAVIGYGNVEGETGEYYYEELPVTVDGKTLSVDLSGKLRRPQDMVTSATLYENITFAINKVKDASGKFVEGGGAGLIGSFSWSLPYKELSKVDVASEFTPANGSSLEGVSAIEVWINGINAIQFDGFRFTYTDGNETKKADVPMSQITREADGSDAAIFTVPVPAAVVGKTNINVAPFNLVSTDGIDHSRDVNAIYDGFAILSSIPANGETFAILPADYTIQITTNYAEKYPEMYIMYEIEDMNPADPADVIVKGESWMTRQEDGSYSAVVPRDIKLLLGHEYHINFTAWESEADKNYKEPAIGSAFISIHGQSAPFVASEITFESIDPAEDTMLAPEETVFTLTFSGLVHISSDKAQVLLGQGISQPFDKIEAVNGTSDSEDGLTYANTWKLTIGEEFMQTLTAELMISVAATDMNGRVVLGNTGTEENSYFLFTYPVNAMYDDFTLTPEDNESVRSLLSFVASSDRTIGFSYAVPMEDAVVMDSSHNIVARVKSVEEYSAIDPREEGDETWGITSLLLTLDTEISEAGTYVFTIPAGYFTTGEQFDAKETIEKVYTYTVTGAGSSENSVTLDPAPDSILASLSSITITFNEEEGISPGSGKATLTRVEDDTVFTLPDLETDWDKDMNVLVQPIGQTITEKGSYDFHIPAGYILCGDDGAPCQDMHFIYTIDDGGISVISPNADGLFDVYSISGMLIKRAADASQLRELPAGIYIVNGVKIIIR